MFDEKQGMKMKKKKVLLHKDIKPCHIFIKTMINIQELHFNMLLYSPYSPDLTLNNCYLVADFTKCSQGIDEQVIAGTDTRDCPRRKV